MSENEKGNGTEISRQNISYYDLIAARYDGILDEDAANTIIREFVATEFTALVKGGYILDFGGGTGRDLGWLTRHSYQILFCEPSAAMRQLAVFREKNEFPAGNVSFFDDHKTDFRIWTTGFPFEQKLDAVLANFAVLNCIPDIGLLFEKLALVIKPGGVILALMLNNSLVKRLRSNLKATLHSFFSGNPVSISVTFDGRRQEVFIHSTRGIKKALADKFEFVQKENLRGYAFCLIHLKRK